MNTTVVYTICVLRSVLFGAVPPPVPDDLSWAELYSYARSQCIENMVFAGVQDSLQAADSGLFAQWADRCEMNLVQSINQMDALEEIKNAFTRADIPYIPLKGCLMKGLYPQEEFRQMSDIDCLIRQEDMARVRTCMEKLGYETVKYGGPVNDNYFRAPYLKVELHRRPFNSAKDPKNYYKDAPCWQRLIRQPGSAEIRFTPEDFYVHMVMHFHGHYKHSGCGLRPVLDLALYRRATVGLNEAYLQQQFRVLGIEDFVSAAEQLGDWFASENAALPEGEPARMLETLTGVSLYGDCVTHMKNDMLQLKEKYRSPVLARFSWLIARLCPSAQKMKKNYPCLEKFPFLLPFCWIHRLFCAQFVKKNLGREMKIYSRARKKL